MSRGYGMGGEGIVSVGAHPTGGEGNGSQCIHRFEDARGNRCYTNCQSCGIQDPQWDRAGEARVLWVHALLAMDEGPARTAELRQMLIDAMDACEQEADEVRLIAALEAFDKAVRRG